MELNDIVLIVEEKRIEQNPTLAKKFGIGNRNENLIGKSIFLCRVVQMFQKWFCWYACTWFSWWSKNRLRLLEWTMMKKLFLSKIWLNFQYQVSYSPKKKWLAIILRFPFSNDVRHLSNLIESPHWNGFLYFRHQMKVIRKLEIPRDCALRKESGMYITQRNIWSPNLWESLSKNYFF